MPENDEAVPGAAKSIMAVKAHLEEAGLDEDAAGAYAVLSLHGPMRAAVLASRVDWPRSKAYRILEAMQHDGLVVASMDRPIEFTAAPPDELFTRLDDQHRARVDELEEARRRLLPVLQDWQQDQGQGMRAGGRFRILKGDRVVGRTLSDLLAEAQEVSVVAGEGPLPGSTMFDAAIKQAEARGCKVTRHTARGVPGYVIVDARELVAGLQVAPVRRDAAFLWTDAEGVLAAYRALTQRL